MQADCPSEITDTQWNVLRRLLPPLADIGRPPLDRRQVLSAILSVCRTGCQWRLLPKEFAKWKSVDSVF